MGLIQKGGVGLLIQKTSMGVSSQCPYILNHSLITISSAAALFHHITCWNLLWQGLLIARDQDSSTEFCIFTVSYFETLWLLRNKKD